VPPALVIGFPGRGQIIDLVFFYVQTLESQKKMWTPNTLSQWFTEKQCMGAWKTDSPLIGLTPLLAELYGFLKMERSENKSVSIVYEFY
jgi:hypothetical protein